MTQENFIKKTIKSLEEYLHHEMWRYTEPPLGREECELFLKLLTQKEDNAEENNTSENLIDREQLIDDLIHFNGPINYVNVKKIILNQSVCHKTDIYKGRRN